MLKARALVQMCLGGGNQRITLGKGPTNATGLFLEFRFGPHQCRTVLLLSLDRYQLKISEPNNIWTL
jgi:hypothetical protein